MISTPVLDSHNSPLQLGQLSVGPRLGAVGFTICPGKKQANSVSGHWRRDMDVDLDTIRRWGAAAVVTLMPMDELHAVQAGGIGDACEARGMEWYHLPITDVDVPDAAFEAAWCYAGLRLRAHLRQGLNVLVHCRGGLGRSGTIAARLLVELGWSPAEAIKAVRAQRKGAIETAAQEKYVHQWAGAVPPERDLHDARVLGCVLGGAVGDAFGYAIEFDRWSTIQRKYGTKGLQQPVLRDGELVVSDDTQMTLFTLEALIESLPTQGQPASALQLRPFLAACQRAYRRWGHTQGVPLSHELLGGSQMVHSPALRQRRAPGNTCLSAVRAGAGGTCEQPINDSKGCGAVMRTAPLGLLAGTPVEQALVLGCTAGALTHGHVDGWLPAGLLAAIVQHLLQGEELPSAVAQALATARQSVEPADTASARLLQAAVRHAQAALPPAVAWLSLGEGWTGDEALAIAVYAAASTRSFEDAIRVAANHDGDSDSTASIAGQLVGARDGILAVPHAWVRRLDVLPDALALLARFTNANNGNRNPNTRI